MYSLDCNYYTAEFGSLQALLDSILSSGMDPSYEITFNGKGIGENAIDLMVE